MIVKVYSTRTCPACNMLKSWLNNKQIEYEVIYVGEDITPEEFVEKTGHTGVPITYVDDEKVIGFNQAQLGALLKL